LNHRAFPIWFGRTYATLRATHSHLFEKFAYAVSQRNLDTFEPQHLANIVWAYSADGKPIFPLFTMVAAAVIVRNLTLLLPQHVLDLSNIILAFVRTAQTSPCLFNTVTLDIIARDLKFFNAQDLANIVWAYAKVDQSNPALFKKFADAVIARDLNPLFNLENLSNIVWAYLLYGWRLQPHEF
jgi:hypothetical protein